MYSRSTAFDDALRYSHVATCRLDVLYGNSVEASDLDITGGQVNVDGTARTRRRGSMTVVDPDGALAPATSTDLLSPFGREIRAYRGIGDEMLPVATLRISEPRSDGAGRIIVAGLDRSFSVSQARLEAPYVIDEGTNFATAIQTLINSRLSGLTFQFVSTTATTPQIILAQAADPWAEAQKMATSIGCDLFFDPMGVCVLRLQTDPASLTLSWDYGEGPDATILDLESALQSDPGFNGVVVDGEAPGFAPVHKELYDTDPLSPTFSGGPYGKRPSFMRTPLIKTQDQADAACAAELRRIRGGTESVKGVAIPHAAHEADDLIHAAYSRVRVDGLYLLESFTIPMDPIGTMPFVCRKRRFT